MCEWDPASLFLFAIHLSVENQLCFAAGCSRTRAVGALSLLEESFPFLVPLGTTPSFHVQTQATHFGCIPRPQSPGSPLLKIKLVYLPPLA